MKKEVTIAIVLGLIVGLIVAIGMYRAQRAVNQTVQEPGILLTDQLGTPLPTILEDESAENSTNLKVAQPLDESWETTSGIRVSGQTTSNTPLIVFHNETEVVGLSDDQGNFSIPITLEAGSNVLVIRALHNNQDPSEVTRTLIYSTVRPEAASSSAKTTPLPTQKPIAL